MPQIAHAVEHWFLSEKIDFPKCLRRGNDLHHLADVVDAVGRLLYLDKDGRKPGLGVGPAAAAARGGTGTAACLGHLCHGDPSG
jgi:hypothetical protein